MADVERVTGAARRRRERRLRSWLKHERQTVRMVLAETFHHSSAPFPPKFKEEWVERHVQHDALRGQNTARTREATYYTSKTSVAGDTAYFSLFDEEDAVWGTRPASLAEPPEPQERVPQRTVEPIVETFVSVPILDVPVLQSGDQLVDVFKFFDISVPEQVIDVPKIISQDSTPQRAVLREPQLVEQLVDVPVPSFHECAVEAARGITQVLARVWDAAGNEWCQVSAPWGVYWWMLGTRHTQWAPPEGATASQGRYINTGQG